jgi:C-terminal processing protease CtpA/Prc
LNQAAVQGLLQQLQPQVTLLAGPTTNASPADTAPVANVKVFDDTFGYVRVGQVGAGLDQALQTAVESLMATNRLKGLVLDLRFASGQDYAAATVAADWFFAAEQPLIDWGEGLKKSAQKAKAFTLPVAVLVNQKTCGAAEALAGMLRFNDVALLIGAATAGQASIAKEFELKTGQRVRVAVAPIKVANGQTLPPTGLKPDIQVDVNPDDEQAWLQDAYKAPAQVASAAGDASTTTTNRSPRRRINEAYLIQLLREGQSPETDLTNLAPRDPPPARLVVQDAALSRALDLLKGLTVVQRQIRSI